MRIILIALTLCLACVNCYAESMPDYDRLANAIYKAEGGAKTSHPYGILAHYKHTTPRQACINTCKNQFKRHAKHNCGKDYWTCLRDRYCPIGASNDPMGLNVNWLKNVLSNYNRG